MGPDLKDKRWIVAKGLLFLFLAVISAAMQLLVEMDFWRESALLLICVWASCRFYYFLFYVLHSYVDPDLKSAGILDLLRKIRRRENIPKI